MNRNNEANLYTTIAFLLGTILSSNLTSTEQNTLGNWLMLVAQILCTNGSYNFNNDWKGHLGSPQTNIFNMLNTMKDSIDEVTNIINRC